MKTLTFFRRATMRLVVWAQVFVLALTVCTGAEATDQVGVKQPAADVLVLDPALGAIRVSSDWQQTTFILLTEDDRTVVEIPTPIDLPYGSAAGWAPPPGYGPKGFWMELRPGRYTIMAGAPGKKLAQATLEVKTGKEIWLNAKLEGDQSKIRVSEPLEKIGPTWSKQELIKVKVKYRD